MEFQHNEAKPALCARGPLTPVRPLGKRGLTERSKVKIALILFFTPLLSWASGQSDVLGTWHVEKVVCSSNNTDLGYYDKIYFTFTIDGKFSSLNPGLSNSNKKDSQCASGEDTSYTLVSSLNKTYLKLSSSIHKDTCGGKERVVPARTSELIMDADGNLRQTMQGAQCDNGKGLRTWVLKRMTL